MCYKEVYGGYMHKLQILITLIPLLVNGQDRYIFYQKSSLIVKRLHALSKIREELIELRRQRKEQKKLMEKKELFHNGERGLIRSKKFYDLTSENFYQD